MADVHDIPLPAGFDAEVLLTIEEVARVLRVTDESVRNFHREKRMLGVKVGKHLRFRPSDVREFVSGLGD